LVPMARITLASKVGYGPWLLPWGGSRRLDDRLLRWPFDRFPSPG
jgi:hypothetical protein